MRIKNSIRKISPIIFVAMMLLVGCRNEQYTDEQGISYDLIGGRFVVVDEYDANTTGIYFGTTIAYDKDTKVMYYILEGYYKTGLCPMYDSNGNVMVYGGCSNAK